MWCAQAAAAWAGTAGAAARKGKGKGRHRCVQHVAYNAAAVSHCHAPSRSNRMPACSNHPAFLEPLLLPTLPTSSACTSSQLKAVRGQGTCWGSTCRGGHAKSTKLQGRGAGS